MMLLFHGHCELKYQCKHQFTVGITELVCATFCVFILMMLAE